MVVKDLTERGGGGKARKFMQTCGQKPFSELEKIAKARGISVQQLIRAVILPEWMSEHTGTDGTVHLPRFKVKKTKQNGKVIGYPPKN